MLIKYIKELNKPVHVVFGIALLLLLLSIAFAQINRPFTSDDIYLQNILLTWNHQGHNIVYLNYLDNYIIKLPFFWFMCLIFKPTRGLAVLESVMLMSAGFTFFYYSSVYFLKKFYIETTYRNLIPFLWIACLGYNTSSLYLIQASRNIEIGLSFIVIVISSKIYFDDIKPFKGLKNIIMSLIFAIVVGLLVFNDKYFLYFTIVPIIIFYFMLFIMKKINIYKLLSLLLMGFIAYIAYILIQYLFNLLDFAEILPSTSLITIHQIYSNSLLACKSIMIIFGLDFTDFNKSLSISINSILNLFIIFIVIYEILKSLSVIKIVKNKLKKQDLLNILLAISCCLVFIPFVLSGMANSDPITYRSFIYFLYLSVLIIFLNLIIVPKGVHLNVEGGHFQFPIC